MGGAANSIIIIHELENSTDIKLEYTNDQEEIKVYTHLQ